MIIEKGHLRVGKKNKYAILDHEGNTVAVCHGPNRKEIAQELVDGHNSLQKSQKIDRD